MKKIEIGNWIFDKATFEAGFIQNIIFDQVTIFYPNKNNSGKDFSNTILWSLSFRERFGAILIFNDKKDYLAYRIKNSV